MTLMHQELQNDLDQALPELIELRRHLHSHPELSGEEHQTAALVAGELRSCGWRVQEGVGRTGVVAEAGPLDGPTVGLRVDMDALPVEERTGLPFASTRQGVMHACGHDGHTAMLIGAAEALAASRNFKGTVHFIFQPAEENFGGGKRMVEEGLFKLFPCDAVFALHNWPGLPAGRIAV